MTSRIGFVLLGLALAACAGEPPDSALEGTPWRLVQIGGQAIVPGTGDRVVHLVLQPSSGRAAGFGGCNRFTGSYQLREDSLEFGALATTRMACLKGGERETAFLEALARVRRWAVAGQRLTLADANGMVLLGLDAPEPR